MGDPTYINFVDTKGKTAQAPDNLSNFLFPPHVLDDPTACLQCAFLSPRNVFVDEFNGIMLDALPGDCVPTLCSEGSRAGTSRRTPDYLFKLDSRSKAVSIASGL
ncbi:hypothetical protein BDR05DRAFT_958039, partial [Suillus weaverae]